MTSTHTVSALMCKMITAQIVLAQFSVKCTTANSQDFGFTCRQELSLIMYVTPLKIYTDEYYLAYNDCHGMVCFIAHANYT